MATLTSAKGVVGSQQNLVLKRERSPYSYIVTNAIRCKISWTHSYISSIYKRI